MAEENGTALATYEHARQALASVRTVDAAKAFRDKAHALTCYARQAKDHELARWVNDIRLRAERRTGELLRDTVTPGNPQWSTPTTIGPTLEQLGISRDESALWQRLAAIPEDDFERSLAVLAAVEVDPLRITTRKIVAACQPASTHATTTTHATERTAPLSNQSRLPAWYNAFDRLVGEIRRAINREDWTAIPRDQREFAAQCLEHCVRDLRDKEKHIAAQARVGASC